MMRKRVVIVVSVGGAMFDDYGVNGGGFGPLFDAYI